MRLCRAVILGLVLACCVLSGCAGHSGAEMPKVRIKYRTPPTTTESCGIDALYVCIHARGRSSIRLADLESQMPLGPRGISLSALAETAAANGLPQTIREVGDDQFEMLSLPAICHVNENHYVALLDVKGGRPTVFDSRVGLYDCTEDKFRDEYRWQGVALALGDEWDGSWRWLGPAGVGTLCLMIGFVMLWPTNSK